MKLNFDLEEKRSFFIMNNKAQYFRGLMGGDALWTNNINEAKTFNEPSKVKQQFPKL